MRTDSTPRTDPSLDRLPSRVRRAWRWLSGRSPQVRMAVAGAALIALIAAGYVATTAPEPVETAWLHGDRPLTPEELEAVLAALSEGKIPASASERGRVAVPASRRGEALALLARKKVGPKGLRELHEQAVAASPWEGPAERAERQQWLKTQELEVGLAKLPGVASAEVRINRAAGHGFGPKAPKVAAIVWLRPADGEPLPPPTIKNVQAVVKSFEPDLPDDALSIFDESGQAYLIAGNPEAGQELMAHAREEQLRRRIKRDLEWIDGVRVFVTLDPIAPAPPHRAESRRARPRRSRRVPWP